VPSESLSHWHAAYIGQQVINLLPSDSETETHKPQPKPLHLGRAMSKSVTVGPPDGSLPTSAKGAGAHNCQSVFRWLPVLSESGCCRVKSSTG
jgi:hypothetical protein